ncbi:neutral zinc metallopeptidase [Sphingomonas sp.]|uniref:KPN_02809 family neutral zinc metallopeptidase n=1 Tax=Sphingomonas sp. TaxID=28214 RepID=UPI001AFCF2A6|nr:neutral zinc metallopeptidase [Sphingomonas sp.]MBO9713582.1 neutral zinc metallopeptidase [Sphingomonas sp.]
MRLDDIDPTENARDLGSGGGGGGFPLLGLLPFFLSGRMGCGGFLLLAVVAAVYLSMGGGGLVSTGAGPGTVSTTAGESGSGVCNTPARLEACKVMHSADLTWAAIFRKTGKQYEPATIYFYTGGANSACGFASSAVGPYYCPGDDGVYLDTAFFDELAQRFGAKGDFARDYVIAHEMGHHIQDLLGISDEVSRRQAAAGETEANKLSVRLELQADCFAGVWASYNKDRLEPGDIEEGLTAAHAIGDDTLQREAQGTVMPDKFTHGTSEERMRWLKRGLDSGDPGQCDTFSGAI